MSICWSDIVDGAPAPGLASLNVVAQDEILADVAENLNPAMLGGESSARYRRAFIYLAAHFGQLAIEAGRGVAGPVQSMSADGLSKSFAVWGSTDPSMLARTAWGQAYLAIIRSGPARLGLVV